MDKHQFGMLSIERPLVWSSDRQTCRMYFFGILEFFTTHGSSISIYLVVDEKCIYKQAVFKPRVRSNKICLIHRTNHHHRVITSYPHIKLYFVHWLLRSKTTGYFTRRCLNPWHSSRTSFLKVLSRSACSLISYECQL